MLDKEISDLIGYAETHLLLDGLDERRAARKIAKLIGVDDFVPEEPDTELIDNASSPDKFVAPLIAYAAEHGKTVTKSEIMDVLCLKPSELNDLFFDTHGVNKARAFDFLYDYNVKSGYVDLAVGAASDRWEAKELKTRIEIIIDLLPRDEVKSGAQCPLCKENEGAVGRENMRTVSLELGGEEWFFAYARHHYFDEHAHFVKREHSPMKSVKDTLVKLAEAADFVGENGFVGTNSTADNGGGKINSHEHFHAGAKNAPMLRAPILRRVKSKEYPYLEISMLDWYGTVFRVMHSNLEKTVEFVDKLIAAWKNYSDAKIVNPDGNKNFVNVVARKVGGKYCFDVVLRSNGMKKHRTPQEYSEIKADALSLNDVLGYFVLPTKLSEQLKQVQLYLDGTVPFDKNDLPEQMKPFAGLVERMLSAQGGTVSKLEAKLNIHDEIDAVCEKILASTAVFDKDTVVPFLDSLDIREL